MHWVSPQSVLIKHQPTLKSESEPGTVFEGYKAKCTYLLKLLFIAIDVSKETLPDLEP